MTRSSTASVAGASGCGRGRRPTTVEITPGGGVKARGGTSNSGRASHSHWVMIDKRP